ncbi:unnamed protein product [Lasius platythorax]|uniref:Uncharacterized protein n=1 Tax=Lasius platythorax TaxID=488582 RepID=A0AAV2NHB1_9HYME
MGDYFVMIANDYVNIKEILSREEFYGRVIDADYIKNRPFKKKLVCRGSDNPRIYERESRIETLGVIHKCVKKTTLGDYETPAKHTPVITNVAAMNNDLDMWGDPENFRSEIFLNENGQLSKSLSSVLVVDYARGKLMPDIISSDR